MNSTVQLDRPFAGRTIERGIPFSTRLACRPDLGLAPGLLGNRACVRAWTARRALQAIFAVRRSVN